MCKIVLLLRRKVVVFIGILLFFITNVSAQQTEIDSLKTIISKNKNDKETVDALYSIGILYQRNNKDKSTLYLNKAVQLATKLNDLENVAWAEEALAINHSDIGDYSKAIAMLLKTLKTGEKLKNTYIQRACLLDLCFIYDDLEDYPKGYYYSNRAYNISKSKVNRNSCLHINGYFLCKMNLPDKALPYFQKELQIAQNPPKKTNQSVKNYLLGSAYTGFGMFHLYKKNYKTSLNFLKKGDFYYLKNSDDAPLIENYHYSARAYRKMKEIDSSILYYQKALKSADKIDYVKGKLDSYSGLAELYETKDPVKSNAYLKLALKLKDSLFNAKQKNEIQALTLQEQERQELIKFNTDKQKEQQIKLLLKEKELANDKRNFLLYSFIAVFLFLISLIGVLIYANKNKTATARKIKELNELKSHFFTNISHEFRTPLTLIKSPLQSLQGTISDKKQQSQLTLIDKNANRMLELIDQLLEISKIESGNLKLILKEGNLGIFLASIIEPFEFDAKEHQINFKNTIEKSLSNHHFDKDVIEKIVTNLLSNAFKYTPANEEISFISTIDNAILRITVSNKNSDLKKEEIAKFFERFYQKNENSNGVGIGLALVKELVALYKGTIETTIEDHLLSFKVNLPLRKTSENAIIVSQQQFIDDEESVLEAANELPILLIVEDNHDIRKVLASLFNDQFQVLEAEDGEKGLEIAQKEIPDCIVSDIMMPKMNGYQLTNAIKSNQITSFIPVVLLTAKSSDEAQLEGIKNAADGYITKPFNNNIVIATVNNLINERKKLQEHYKKGFQLKSVAVSFNNADESFIEKVQHIVESQLSNADYSADDFAKEISMSRMQLHRKLKSLIGVSVTELLRNERLKAAAKLFQSNDSIAEIAYAVGFNNISYFSKCFKEMYRKTPSEYIDSL